MARNGKKKPYVNANGVVVPSVTTILSRFKDSGGLIYWAFKEGLVQGREIEAAVREGKTARAPDLYREQAAQAGTMAHDLVEAHLKGQALPALEGAPETIAKANRAFDAYLAWEALNHFTIHHTEVELVSENHQFGGRLDAVGSVNNKLVLLDWKTSNAIYADYTMQLAAYALLWEESYPDYPLEGGFHLCRFAKEEGDFVHAHFPGLDREKVAFTTMVKLYASMKEIERRVK